MTSTRPLRLSVLALLVLLLLAVPALPASAAAWGWPLAAPHPVTRPFDPGPQRWSPGHRGVDLAASPGSPVRAAGSGRVSFAGPLAGRGVVVVDHGTLRTTYEPVTASVVVGQSVRTGDALGVLDGGHPGCPAPACLHWGLLRGDTYLDPLRLVTTGPVRLLPRAPGSARAQALTVLPPPAPSPDGARSAPGAAAAGQPRPPARTSRWPEQDGVAAAALAGGLALALVPGRSRSPRSPRAALSAPSGPRASRAAAERPWCASGRSGSP